MGRVDPTDSNDHGQGKIISELAHNTPAPGKGKIISAVASGGKSHAGNPPGQAKKGGDEAGSHKPLRMAAAARIGFIVIIPPGCCR